MRANEKDGSSDHDGARSDDDDEFPVEWLFVGEFSVEQFVEMVGDIWCRERSLVEIERDVIRRAIAGRWRGESVEYGSVLQLIPSEDALGATELGLDEDVLRLDRLVLVPLLGELFELGLEHLTWWTLDAARSGGEQCGDSVVAWNLNDLGEFVGVDIDKSLARRLDSLEERLLLFRLTLCKSASDLAQGEKRQQC